MKTSVALPVLICLAGCAAATSTPVSEAASPSQPQPTATVPDQDGSAGVTHPSADVEGRLVGDVNLGANCAWVTDADGTAWEIGILPDGYAVTFEGGVPTLSGPDGQEIARGGDRIGLNGIKDPPDLGSVCMVGRVFATEEIVWVDRR